MTDGPDASGALDVLVTGRSLPALLAALDLAEVGLSVAVADGPLDLPSGPERDPDGDIASFLERIAAPIEKPAAPATGSEPGAGDGARMSGSHAGALPRFAEPRAPWLIDPAGRWAPQSTPNVLGVPAVPLASENLRLLGAGGAMRAYLDRLKPLLTIGKTRAFGQLVRRRIGRRACERLVEPLVRERYGVAADDVEVAIAAPGLNEALSRAGSLTSAALAYSDRNARREIGVEPEAGWESLAAETISRLSFYGVEFIDAAVVSVEPKDSGWQAALESGDGAVARAIVLDRGTPGLPSVVADGAIAALDPQRLRVHASVDIHEPEGLGADAVGVRIAGDWTIRVEQGPDLRWRASLGSPVLQAFSADDPFSATVGVETLRAAGLSALPEAQWAVRLAAAPFAEGAQLHAAEARLADAVERMPELLPVGRVLHGDDLGAAIGAAHAGAVVLRRRLLGLSA